MKRLALAIAGLLARLWGLLPGGLRRRLLLGFFVLEGRAGDPAQGLRNLLRVKDGLDLAINERAMAYGRGEHPKHRLTNYHRFFIDHIPPAGGRVLDIGCGYGAVARSVAEALPAVEVLGVDMDEGRLNQAKAMAPLPNLSFLFTDATRSLPPGAWHTVILSNVLEHIDHRPDFLRAVVRTASPDRLLIRVPLFERDWEMPLRRALGINYLSDPDHRIEHTLQQFRDEVAAAGLAIIELNTLWGEIWAECRPAAA
jgi:2-polyprenyl-3-methyl-5-hydroxy-6-metoxy-1,4-benzoquinol methylase